jgi:hypothetical protein
MYAQLVQQLPTGNNWLYEVKFDGYRCLAGRDSKGVTLWSKRGNDFTAHFPTLQKDANNSHLAHYSMERSLPSMRTVASLSTFFNITDRKRSRCCSMRLMF